MGGIPDLYRKACERFGEMVMSIQDDQWSHATPCTGWDLARAIGADETIDPELLDAVEPYYTPLVELLKATGAFGPVVEPPEGADRQTTLLAMLGRKAW